MIKRTNIQAFIFSKNPSFKILILKRIPERSGYWQPVCGGVENKESLIETVIREVFEETGISNIKSILDLDYTFTYREVKEGELMEMQDYCFAVEINNVTNIKLSNEHEEYKWCSYDQAKEILKWEHNLIALEKLMCRI
ncbi:NUDIX pyrophosphatase [Tissierella carlieri]|uniref:NUDIX pyrophosphatase n=1 Tax=Tissierella carlieri TaxID=689904 RepID=A0ABT1SCW0_9FIRM|nr:NUDIX pyrophosphatase [Tissierella carlieri]MCQ4924298.1 NUDIX pyrophosphatase [Tissierella carlieri]